MRLIAGSIIRELLASGFAIENFWPEPVVLEIFADFPKSQYHTAAWVTEFEGFVGGLESQHLLTQA